MFKPSAKRLCRAGVIAALYAALTLVSAPIAFGPLQLRVAETLTALPLLFPEAVPALAVGCAISNLLSPLGLIDVAAGSAVTLVAALLTRLCRKKPVLAMLFPVLLNAALLPALWYFVGGEGAWLMNCGSVLLTQTVFCMGGGLPLYYALKKRKETSRFLQD